MTRKIAVVALVLGFIASIVGVHAHIPHDVVDDIQLSPAFARDHTVFAIVRGVLFISADGGYTWKRRSGSLGDQWLTALAISPAYPDDHTLFVASRDGVYRSQDAGRSWERCSDELADAEVVALSISPWFATDRVVFALGAQGTLYRTTQAGASWERVFHEASNVTAIGWKGNEVIAGTGAGTLYVSGDDGAAWTTYGQHPGGLPITSLAVPDGWTAEEPFFVGTETAGVFSVVGDGQFRDAGLPGHHVTSLVSYSSEGKAPLLFASTWDEAVFRSDDSGTTWSTFDSGLIKHEQADAYGVSHFRRIVVAEEGTMFLGGFCGVFRSDDVGKSWYPLETTLHHIIGLDVSPEAGTGYTVSIATYGGGAYSSSDGGVTWNANNRGFWNPRLGAMAYSPTYAEDHTVFVAHYNHVLKSTDGGTEWHATRIQRPPPRAAERLKGRILELFSRSQTLNKLTSVLPFLQESSGGYVYPLAFAVSPSFAVDQTLFASTIPPGILRSVDGGTTFSWVWDAEGSRVWSLVVSPDYAEDQTVFASLQDGLYRSLNGGEHWERIGQDVHMEEALLAISPQYNRDHTLYAGSAAGLFRSQDGGTTWTALHVPARGADVPVAGLAISPTFAEDRQVMVQVRGGELLIGRDRGDRLEVIPSTSADAGYEFSQLVVEKESAPLIRFSPNYREDKTLYAASVQHLVKSTDGGKTWMEIPRPVRYEVEADFVDHLVFPILLEGTWDRERRRHYSNMQAIVSTQARSAATLSFVGTGVSWIGSRGPDRGTADVFIDGALQTSVDQYGEKEVFSEELFRATGLAYGPHTITVQVADAKNERSSGRRVDIDAVDVRR